MAGQASERGQALEVRGITKAGKMPQSLTPCTGEDPSIIGAVAAPRLAGICCASLRRHGLGLDELLGEALHLVHIEVRQETSSPRACWCAT